MATFLSYLAARLKEPSSYAGLAALLGLVGLHFTDGQLASVVTLLTAVASAVAVFVPDTARPSA